MKVSKVFKIADGLNRASHAHGSSLQGKGRIHGAQLLVSTLVSLIDCSLAAYFSFYKPLTES